VGCYPVKTRKRELGGGGRKRGKKTLPNYAREVHNEEERFREWGEEKRQCSLPLIRGRERVGKNLWKKKRKRRDGFSLFRGEDIDVLSPLGSSEKERGEKMNQKGEGGGKVKKISHYQQRRVQKYEIYEKEV